MKNAFENDEEDEEDSRSSSGGWQTEEEDEHEGQHESALDVNALEPPTAPLTENQKVNQKVLQDALTAPLTAEQDEAVNAALANGSATEVLASGSSHFADITLKRMDVATMAPGQWLNDEMVNFTLGAMVAREARRVGVGADGSTPVQPRTHFMSTYYITKMCAEQDNGGRAYNYDEVKNWTTREKLGYDALLCETIIVPVNQGNFHWVLATVEPRKKRVRLYDSLLGEDRNLLNCLKRWVEDEYKDKKGGRTCATAACSCSSTRTTSRADAL
jgi:Ulp1 family protease